MTADVTWDNSDEPQKLLVVETKGPQVGTLGRSKCLRQRGLLCKSFPLRDKVWHCGTGCRRQGAPAVLYLLVQRNICYLHLAHFVMVAPCQFTAESSRGVGGAGAQRLDWSSFTGRGEGVALGSLPSPSPWHTGRWTWAREAISATPRSWAPACIEPQAPEGTGPSSSQFQSKPSSYKV